MAVNRTNGHELISARIDRTARNRLATQAKDHPVISIDTLTPIAADTDEINALIERSSTPSNTIRVPGGNAAWRNFISYVDLVSRLGHTELEAISAAYPHGSWKGDLVRYRLSTLL